MARVKNYYFIISPDDKVKKHIEYFKLYAKTIIGSYPSCKSIAHITVGPFEKKFQYEIDAVIESIEAKINNLPCIKVSLKDFAFFEHGSNDMTFFVAIKSNYQFDKWFDDLVEIICKRPKSKRAHITIAKDLVPNSYYLLWPRFLYQNYEASFIADKVSVFEEDPFEPYAKWIHYKDIMLDNSVQIGGLTKKFI